MALGAQLGAGLSALSFAAAGLGVGLRLVLAPLASWGLLLLVPPRADLFDLLLVGAAAPVGILLPLLCAVHGRHAEQASAMVLVSTLLSPLLITVLVIALRAG